MVLTASYNQHYFSLNLTAIIPHVSRYEMHLGSIGKRSFQC